MDLRMFGRAALVFAAAMGYGCEGGPFATGRIVEGEWGGDGALLRADEDAARLEIGCAAGFIRGSIRLDDDGAFSRRGSMSLNGPIGPLALAATFSGRVTDGRMTLDVDLAPGGPEIEFLPVTLELDRPASLPLCAAG
jgi:hypothetical protein